ncbi:hypothetical protein [Streptomyces qinzhouensis]|uniref:hypothetical protein n=1 Tax=Streptomyces qinzhouensis TaxID=2599401 RepID=UPI0016473799|nr:hypothetical protein [Streptomyces qinzhouensis]
MTATACARCRELTDEEREARAVRDQSRAADCRVLRRRHEEAGHPPAPPAS